MKRSIGIFTRVNSYHCINVNRYDPIGRLQCPIFVWFKIAAHQIQEMRPALTTLQPNHHGTIFFTRNFWKFFFTKNGFLNILAIPCWMERMRRPVGLVTYVHSKINIHNKRAKPVPNHSYQPVIKWVFMFSRQCYQRRCRYVCRCHRLHIHWHIICQCIHCLIRITMSITITLIITIITLIRLTCTINRHRCHRNSIQVHRPFPVPIHNQCTHDSNDARFPIAAVN